MSLSLESSTDSQNTCNFSGAGTPITGVDSLDNESLFTNNVGIPNTATNGQIYMQGNATATTVSDTAVFYLGAGTTIASADNERYLGSSAGRLTNEAIIQRKFLIIASLSFETTNGNVCQFGFYDSRLSAIREPSKTFATANASGRDEHVSMQCVVSHSSGDYLEVHCRNSTGTNDITITDLNFTITQLGD